MQAVYATTRRVGRPSCTAILSGLVTLSNVLYVINLLFKSSITMIKVCVSELSNKNEYILSNHTVYLEMVV